MKRRRGRRGFWWWSWLLALVTVAGVVGGFLYGKKRWEDGPKDYLSAAKVSVHIRAPFVAKGAKLEASGSRLENLNEEAVLRDIKSDEALTPVIAELGLSQKWEMGTGDTLTELRGSVRLEHDRLLKELYVIVSRHDPNEAAQIANMIASGVSKRIKIVDGQQKLEGTKKMEQELEPFMLMEGETRIDLKDAFAAKGITINPKPGMDVSTYLLEPSIRDAYLEWDGALRNLSGVKESQGTFSNHWRRDMRPTIVTEKAMPPPSFVGPEAEPIQMQWALYGLTLGLIIGSVLSLICWKLFP